MLQAHIHERNPFHRFLVNAPKQLIPFPAAGMKHDKCPRYVVVPDSADILTSTEIYKPRDIRNTASNMLPALGCFGLLATPLITRGTEKLCRALATNERGVIIMLTCGKAVMDDVA